MTPRPSAATKRVPHPSISKGAGVRPLRNPLVRYYGQGPVKRKLVSHPKDWPWSSWSYYEKGDRGLIAIDSVDDQAAWKQKQIDNPHP
jgi:hypothetical protein